jgi:murein DD-endopeptidase MepM/ murein hydrolase activator NlpD
MTPALRTKLRNRPDDYTNAERRRFGSRDVVEYRRQLRGRHRGSGALDDTFAGSPIPGTRRLTPDHQTAGLAGFPARDYFAPGGSPCVAPADGKVSRLSGHDPRNGPPDGPHGPFGWSVYIDGDDGKTYYLTHMGSRDVSAGERVTQGEKIGTVGNYDVWGGTDHVHMGVHA